MLQFYKKLSCSISTARRRAGVETHKPRWWTNETETHHQMYKLTNNENDRLQYERLRRHTEKFIRRNRRNLEVYITNTTEIIKEFYSYVRKKKVLTSTLYIRPLRLQNGQLETDEKKMADLLNEYFASVFTKEDIGGLQA